MGLIQRCKAQWALAKEMRIRFKAEWERAKRWRTITQAEAETLSDEELWDCITSRLPQVEEPEELAALAGSVRVVYTLYWYDLEVQNGGLCQYFVNSSRMTALYLPEALTAVGAEGYRQDFEGFVRENRIDTGDLSSFIIRDAKEFSYQNGRYPFDSFDAQFYDRYERSPLDALATAYIRRNLAAFFEE